MNIFTSIVLGLLQGLTEFLPVSSSGHLVIAQSIIPNFSQPGIVFDVVLHGGTLFAILFYFRKDLLELTRKYLLSIIVGTIPAIILGLLFENGINAIFTNTTLVGLALFVSAFFNLMTDKTKEKKTKLNFLKATYIGIAQAIAIIPGISRSGATIFAGSSLGLRKEKAAEFSFLLSVPAVAGANILQFANHAAQIDTSLVYFIAGFVAAFVSGYFAIRVVYKALSRNKFRYFSYYLILLGTVVLTVL
jgi:undecaprenyl-diphosphatase